jgi:serine/threonine protein kinase
VDALIPGIDPESIGDWKILYRISASDNSVIYFGSRGIAGSEEAAIKVIGQNESLDESSLERLRVEVDALERMNNPHVARLIAKDLDSKPAWIATEYLGKKSLEIKLRQDQAPVEGIYWWELARAIFSGLSALHSVNIVHRDIKPSNIMIDGSTVKIIDFGISYVPGHTATREKVSLQFEGSRPFAAPENYSNRFAPTMDVFSAAATLAYAARLKSIWDDQNEETLSESIRKGSPDLSGLGPEQIELLKPLLDKYASQRPSSETALNKILEYIEHLANSDLPKPVPLRGSTAVYRLFRNKAFKLVASITLIGAVLSSLVLTDPEVIYLTEQETSSSTGSSIQKPIAESELPTGSTSSACEEAYLNNDNDIAKKCLEPANAGDLRSIYYLGVHEEENNNIKAAESWFLKSAQQDDALSMAALVQIYIDTNQTEKFDLWVKRCADFPMKIRQVARCKLLYGLGQQQDGKLTSKGILYLKDAYDYGNGAAATSLGIHYNSLKEYENALSWWERAAELDESNSVSYLISLANKVGKKDLAMKWLKIYADKGDPKFASVYAASFLESEDYKNAKKYALIGANGGDVNSMGLLGVILWKSDNNIKEAKIWLNRAAKDNDVNSINVLGDIARLEDKDNLEALEWYKKSEKLGNLQGGYYVGLTYAGGFGNGPSACSSFKNVLVLAEKLRKSQRYETSMDEWVVKSNEAIPEVCL